MQSNYRMSIVDLIRLPRLAKVAKSLAKLYTTSKYALTEIRGDWKFQKATAFCWAKIVSIFW